MVLLAGSYKVIELFEVDMKESSVLLRNDSITTTLQTMVLCRVKIEPSQADVMVLGDTSDDGIFVVDLATNSTLPFRSPRSLATPPTPPIPIFSVPSTTMPLR